MTVTIQSETQRPGYAIRAPEFGNLVALAESFGPNDGISQAEIERGILFGLTDLSDKEQKFLLLATALLSHKDIQKGNAFCYLGGYSFRRALGGNKGPIQKRTLSRIKKSLEDKGLIIRHYDQRHNPLEKQGIDLRPLLARIDEIQDRAEEFFQETRDYFEEQQAIDRYNYNVSLKDMEGCLESHPNRLNPTKVIKTVQTNTELSSTKPITSKLKDQLNADQHSNSENTQSGDSDKGITSICSPKGASVFWKGYEKSGKQRHLKAVEELRDVVQLSDQLMSYVPLSAIELADENLILEGCYRFIDENFAQKRNSDQTFYWAVKQYGWKAVLLLVCAIEDITIQSREGWLGFMTTRNKKRTPDLRTNLDRIRKEKSKRVDDEISPSAQKAEKTEEAPESKTVIDTLPVEEDPHHQLWSDVKAYVLQEELMSEAEVRTWLDPSRIDRIYDDEACISTKTAFQRDYIEKNFIKDLQTAMHYLLGKTFDITVDSKPQRLRH